MHYSVQFIGINYIYNFVYYYHYFQNLFIIPNKNCVILSNNFLFPLPPASSNLYSDLVSINLPVLDTSVSKMMSYSFFMCLASFSLSKFHPCVIHIRTLYVSELKYIFIHMFYICLCTTICLYKFL